MEQAFEPAQDAKSSLLEAILGHLEAAFEGLVLLNRDFELLAANQTALSTLGFDPSESLAGLHWEEVARLAGIAPWARRIIDDGNLNEEIRIEKPGAEPRALEIRVRRDIRPGVHLIALRDVTERWRRSRNEATYTAVTKVLLESMSMAEAIPRLLEALGASLGWSFAELFRVDPETKTLKQEGSWYAGDCTEAGGACRQCTFASGEGTPGLAWACGEPIWIDDLTSASGFPCGSVMRSCGMKSGLAFPVRSRGAIAGVLVFFSTAHRHRDPHMLRLLTALDALIAQFLERVQLLEAERAQREQGNRITERLRLLHGVTTALSRAVTSDDVTRVVIQASVKALHADSALLYLLDPATQQLQLQQSINYDSTNPWHRGFGLDAPRPVAESVREKKPLYVCGRAEFVRRYPLLAAEPSETFETWVTLPLLVHGSAMGAIRLTFKEKREFAEQDRELLQSIARQCALALDRARLFEAERVAKEQAESERSLLRTILMNAPVPVVVWAGPDYVVQMANEAWLDIVRLPGNEDVLGKPLRLAPPILREAAEQIAVELDRIHRTGESLTFSEFRMVLPRPDGSREVHYYTASAQPIRDAQGRIEAVVQIAADITEQVLARQQHESARAEAEAATRAKDEFLAVLSHELRTPLQSILGWTHFLLSRGFDPKLTRRGVETIERNTKQQAKLIEQLLDVSRIVAGKIVLDRHPLELTGTVEAAVDSLRNEVHQKAIELECRFDGPMEVLGDADRLRQVVTNLLGNALKFTPEGGRITLVVEREGTNAKITVSDTGRGIPQAMLPHIFEAFRQADASSRRLHGGLGLGLAIVKHLVELHGGDVRAESEGEGHGATFTVRLPMFRRKEHAIVAEQAAEGSFEPSTPLAKVRVLVVDDDPDASEVLAMALAEAGAEVQTACSVKEATERFWESRPDVLVSDIAMPDQDGYEMIRRVRAIDESLGTSTPAIALTAFASPADRAQALAAGYQTHLAKPVTATALVQAVARLYERKRVSG